VRGVEAQGHLPLVGRAIEIAAIRVDPREHIVRVRYVRVPVEPAQGNAQRNIHLPGTTKRVREWHEHEARWIARQVIAEATNFVSHHRPP